MTSLLKIHSNNRRKKNVLVSNLRPRLEVDSFFLKFIHPAAGIKQQCSSLRPAIALNRRAIA
jgi:hypothetical protein